MKSVPDRRGIVVFFPADPDLFFVLAAVSAFAFMSACLLSGAPVGLLLRSPLNYFRGVLSGATARGEPYFWFVWLLFCIAVVTLVGAILVAIALVGTVR